MVAIMVKVNVSLKVSTKAILEMIRQVGAPKFDEKGMIQKGVMIRHLVLVIQLTYE